MAPSGKDWVGLFPTSDKLSDLEPAFRADVVRFLNALQAAGATIKITATRRPRQRAYLMHYAWCIAKHWKGTAPASIPAFVPDHGEVGVDITWLHLTAQGAPDLAASVAAAQAMVTAYGIAGLHVPPALNSNHIRGLAIDMLISWREALTIRDKQGTIHTIKSLPRSGVNADLLAVGKSYGVRHLRRALADPPHWSHDGR